MGQDFRFAALRALGVLLCALCLLLPGTGQAQAGSARCFAASASGEPIARVAADPARWNCRADGFSLEPERTLIRFRVPDTGDVPTHFVSRRSHIGGFEVLALTSGGEAVRKTLTIDDQVPADIGTGVKLPLPRTQSRPHTIIVALDRPTNSKQLGESFLAPAGFGDDAIATRGKVIVAFICGMLLMPLIFNFAFYRVLRERFVLWHAAIACAMLFSVAFSSNIVLSLLPISMQAVSDGATVGFGLVVATGAMFAHSFIEPGKLHPWLRRALPWTAGYAMTVSLLHAAFPNVLRAQQLELYMAAYIPVLAILVAVLANALWHRSRAAMFQFIAWAPMLLIGLVRQVSYLLPGLQPTDAMYLFYAACALEVIATAAGVADRMLTLRIQRDSALVEARTMEALAERDALTGLLNRRAVEPRFADLRAQGFDTLAIVDLDRFKEVNDVFGHQLGDEVLVACGHALASDASRDTIAARMGGEEFVLLLRGKDTQRRAEALRLAITVRVAREVAGLDRPLTASMGLIEVPRHGMASLGFEELYARADKLLYEAKQAGRNRSVYERLTVFEPPAARRTRAAA